MMACKLRRLFVAVTRPVASGGVTTPQCGRDRCNTPAPFGRTFPLGVVCGLAKGGSGQATDLPSCLVTLL
jgi:hypothetical protein